MNVQHISSRDNPLLKELRKLSQDNAAYRKSGRIWVEGEHLCSAALARGVQPELALFAESFWQLPHVQRGLCAIKNIVISDALMAQLSGLESAPGMGFVIALQPSVGVRAKASTLVLDRVQDAGNVGSMLRCAAAFGYTQVLALKGTAALWSPKVLRAGMGAHFALSLLEGLDATALQALDVPLLATSSHEGALIESAPLPWPCAWAMGHEGQGVGPEVLARAHQYVRIGQPGGEESLNVAAAAAICLHAGSVSEAARAARGS